MTQEMKGQFGGQGQVEYREHSNASGAKKTILGPVAFPAESTDERRSVKPISGALGGTLALVRGKAYRLVSNSAFCMVQFDSKAGGAAIVAALTDMYVPAGTPIVVKTDSWDSIAHVAFSAAGTIWAVEVL